MIVLAVTLDQFRLEVLTDLGEDSPKITDCQFRQHVTTIFGDEDQVNMKAKNHISASAIFHVDSL